MKKCAFRAYFFIFFPPNFYFSSTFKKGTGKAFIDAMKQLPEAASSARYPVLILHDPEDQICLYEGSETFIKRAKKANARLVNKICKTSTGDAGQSTQVLIVTSPTCIRDVKKSTYTDWVASANAFFILFA